ncbi:MAG: transposase [Bacteroidetes bacterium]|nr:transposase [Bacteroidota bacterium]
MLDMYLFTECWQVQEHADKWLRHYNTERPHEGLKNQTPAEWAQANARCPGGGTSARTM